MGVLSGLKVLEFEAIGPAPFCGMVLADMGADVIRVDRAVAPEDLGISRGGKRQDVLKRNRRSVLLDLKNPDGVAAALELVSKADVLIEGFRPGVMERLGLGPGRGAGAQPAAGLRPHDGLGPGRPAGPAGRARHQLHRADRRAATRSVRAGERPVPPLNLVGDFGGGGMLLAVGMLAALLRAAHSGRAR